MRRISGFNIVIVLLSLFFSVGFTTINSQETEVIQTAKVKVVGVSDGDTIKVLLDGVETRIRMASIDCPEKSQAFGQAAKKYTSDACFGKTVTVKITDTDMYGRKIAFVVLDDGTDLNRNLVRDGLAWHYKRYSKDTSLDALEAAARNTKLGLWTESNPVPPWDYRKKQKSEGN